MKFGIKIHDSVWNKLKNFDKLNNEIIRKLVKVHLKDKKMISYQRTNKTYFNTDYISLSIDSYYMIHFMGSYKYKEQIIFLKNNEMLSNCNYQYRDDIYNYIYNIKIVTKAYNFIEEIPILPVKPFENNFENKLK